MEAWHEGFSDGVDRAGTVFFGLGALDAALPIVPTTPFLLMAAFCFARSSRWVNDWFRATRLYRAVVAIVWMAHVVYFGFVVLTESDGALPAGDAEASRGGKAA